MRFLFVALTCIVSLVGAQVASPPECGVNTIISAISSSGCSITDASCLCKNTKVIDNIKKELPKKCTNPSDQETYATFFNLQCSGYPGFPLNFTQDAQSSDAKANRARLGFLAVAAGVALF
ncbi:uncharacterized protein PV09_00454 [Verruconis gallopava]|uniref:CFEM domain-containing protein n=1 Tax=Verruconis gallopava TaxID=253628 RepID=A0A0D1Z9E3_9PEZI|nr:uncharacterized protein PV09_00454 [Verruconis gallopava]KIW09582.1 hypothetical protein PV09_00454 [Verruconis gallopava]